MTERNAARRGTGVAGSDGTKIGCAAILAVISAPRAYGFVGHISHQDKISATRQARRAHPQAHTTASDRSNTHDNGQDQLAAPNRYDARPSHSYRTLSQLSTYGIAPQHGSARTQYFLTRDPNVPRPTPTATRTNITARASMRPGHLDNVPIRLPDSGHDRRSIASYIDPYIRRDSPTRESSRVSPSEFIAQFRSLRVDYPRSLQESHVALFHVHSHSRSRSVTKSPDRSQRVLRIVFPDALASIPFVHLPSRASYASRSHPNGRRTESGMGAESTPGALGGGCGTAGSAVEEHNGASGHVGDECGCEGGGWVSSRRSGEWGHAAGPAAGASPAEWCIVGENNLGHGSAG
ncbi:hypothetical protein BD779DRAFT_1472362 [Infundibulicybe gibba]|nr:hypothetical protein BD779DRAFT_1472362 [Infundibulicybe gibba]